jgi:hypothetical protein
MIMVKNFTATGSVPARCSDFDRSASARSARTFNGRSCTTHARDVAWSKQREFEVAPLALDFFGIGSSLPKTVLTSGAML